MHEYLLMVLENEAAHASEEPKAVARLLAAQATFADGLRRAGTLNDSGRFRPSKEGKRVRRVAERVEIESGPFAENGLALGSYYSVEASDAESAAKIALQCPALPADAIDVRPVMKGKLDPDKEGKPGKLFAFGVLGNAAKEEDWVAIMDRIDEETREPFDRVSACGGVRLLPPKTGRRVATLPDSASTVQRRAMFDGPFLESKEVIGGLFFLRMTNIDEAVRWASDTPFVVHGALEIRELWRS